MNAEQMWKQSGLQGTYEAWQYGSAPDQLASLTYQGIKTATSSSYEVVAHDLEPMPEVGGFSVILGSDNEAVCIIQTTKVNVVPFDQVSEEHAYKEGEGSRTLDEWRRVHQEFFTEELKRIDQVFHPKMKVICEEFKVVYKGEGVKK